MTLKKAQSESSVDCEKTNLSVGAARIRRITTDERVVQSSGDALFFDDLQ